jgi:hypothetical protein
MPANSRWDLIQDLKGYALKTMIYDMANYGHVLLKRLEKKIFLSPFSRKILP